MEIKKEKGFSFIEVVIAVAIIGTLLAIAIPGFTGMAPRMRLKSAARDIVSNIQLVKAQALRDRKSYTIEFDTVGGKYTVNTGGIITKTVNLSEYSGVTLGSGFGKAGDDNGPDDVSDGVTFDSNRITLNSDGTVNIGGVYLKDSDDMTYSVICLSAAGGVKTLKNSNGSVWE